MRTRRSFRYEFRAKIVEMIAVGKATQRCCYDNTVYLL